jgi:lantibiotic modifying enzyme
MDVSATPAGTGSAARQLSPGWWTRALTSQERTAAASRTRPSWADVVEQAVAAASPGERPAAGGRPDALALPTLPFLALVREQLAAGARGCLPSAHADPGRLADAYAAALSRQLAGIACRTMTFELGRAGTGDDGRVNLAAFAGRLSTPAGLAALFGEYPVLARLLGSASQLAIEAGLELVTRFAADRQAIVAELLGGADPGPAVAIEPGLGDRHRHGRSVAAVTFADGRRVIYKPRSLAAHIAFRQVADWVSQRVPGAGLEAPATVARPGYGWLEFVTARPLPAPSAAAGFYRRAGMLLAALYATHASDMHSENLIARGAVPVLIDVETLFHPDLPAQLVTAADPAAAALSASVQRTALLPYVTVGENGALDQSGLGGGEGEGSAASNRPRLGGEALEPADYEAAVLEGFRLAYDAIAAEKADFGRLAESFGDIEVRAVARPTSGYARLISESTAPELLRDALDRDQALDVLREASAGQPLWASLVPYELHDLRNGDIPLLTSRPSTPDLWTSGGERLPGSVRRPGLRGALDKIAVMGEIDRRDQEWVISASLAARRPHGGHRAAGPVPGPVTATAAEPGRLLAAACGLADQIVAVAAPRRGDSERGRVNWLGLQLVEDTRWMLLPMGASLADGYLGVALFLAQLAELTGIDRYADVGRRAVSPLPELLHALGGRPELVRAVGCGGLSGLGGISYGLARMSVLLRDPDLARWAGAAAEMAATADLAASPGWTAGSAGCLAAMLSVRADTGSRPAGDLALVCADYLSELAGRTDGRCVPDGDPVPAGFAAGPAGVGWALSRFATASAEPRYLVAARGAAWRATEGRAAAGGPAGWCSGAAGLLLARIAPLAEDSGLDAAVRALAERPVPRDLSACHGELGLAEALTVLAASGSKAAYRARRHRAGLILDLISRHGPYCGTPGGIATPGLLNGLAGIGYGLLRLGFAERVPSALLLEPGPSHSN